VRAWLPSAVSRDVFRYDLHARARKKQAAQGGFSKPYTRGNALLVNRGESGELHEEKRIVFPGLGFEAHPTHARACKKLWHGVSFLNASRARAKSPGVCLPPGLFLNVHKIRVDSDNKR